MHCIRNTIMCRQIGLTLIELMIYISLMLGGLFVAQGYAQMQSEKKLTLATAELRSILHYARTQAFIAGEPLKLNILEEKRRHYSFILTTLDDSLVLRQWADMPKNLHYQWEGVDGKKTIRFSHHPSSGHSNGRLCVMNNEHCSQCLKVSRIGKIKLF